MSAGDPLLYLSDADVSALDLGVHSVRPAIQDAFRLYGDGRLRSEPKTSIWIGPGHAFQSLAVVDTQRGLAALKWIGMVPQAGQPRSISTRASFFQTRTRASCGASWTLDGQPLCGPQA